MSFRELSGGLWVRKLANDELEICDEASGDLVILNFDAQLDLTDIICTPIGGCDKLKDCKDDLRLTKEGCDGLSKES